MFKIRPVPTFGVRIFVFCLVIPIQVLSEGQTEDKRESPKLAVVPDISGYSLPENRVDGLRPGQKYSLSMLRLNQSPVSRSFFVEAYILNVYRWNPDVNDFLIPLPDHLIIGDRIVNNDQNSMVDLFYTENASEAVEGKQYEVGKKYLFEVSVKNISETLSPRNEFMLVTAKKLG